MNQGEGVSCGQGLIDSEKPFSIFYLLTMCVNLTDTIENSY